MLLPRFPLTANTILGNAATIELECDCYSKSQSDGRYLSNSDFTPLDGRYFPVNGNAGGNGIFPMVITTLTPRMIRAVLPRAPLSGALILGNAGTLELSCDCYIRRQKPTAGISRRRWAAPWMDA